MISQLFYQKDNMGVLTYIIAETIDEASIKTGFPVSQLHPVSSVFVDPAQVVSPSATVPPTVPPIVPPTV